VRPAPDLFHAACRLGLEGLVSKRRDRPYRAGRCTDWRKIKNRKHPTMSRVMEIGAWARQGGRKMSDPWSPG
jgi:ATP-dependent DNA ligase